MPVGEARPRIDAAPAGPVSVPGVTTGAWASLAVAAAFALANWYSRLRHDRRLEYLTKPAALAALVAAAVLLDPADPTRRAWFVAALICGLAGDVFLMLPSDRFVAGLASFLVGHLFYIAGFMTEPPSLGAVAVSAAAVALVVGPVAVRLLRALRESGHEALAGPVAGYMGVIAAMWVAALASGNPLAGVGGGLFVASDSLIAWDRFVRPLRWAGVVIMLTYHLAQAGLALSLLR